MNAPWMSRTGSPEPAISYSSTPPLTLCRCFNSCETIPDSSFVRPGAPRVRWHQHPADGGDAHRCKYPSTGTHSGPRPADRDACPGGHPSPSPPGCRAGSSFRARRGSDAGWTGSALTLPGDPGRDLGPAAEAELVEDVGHVAVDRALRDHELLGDLVIGQPARDERGDLELAAAEQVLGRCRGCFGLRLGQRVLDRLIERHRAPGRPGPVVAARPERPARLL